MKSSNNDIDFYLLDACIVISILKNENDEIANFLGEIALSGKIAMNEINLFEARYILKQHLINKSIDIDSILDRFVEELSIYIYKNTQLDFKIASDIKSKGGLSPYDSLMLAQINNNQKINYQLITQDQEFNKPKFLNNFNIRFF